MFKISIILLFFFSNFFTLSLTSGNEQRKESIHLNHAHKMSAEKSAVFLEMRNKTLVQGTFAEDDAPLASNLTNVSCYDIKVLEKKFLRNRRILSSSLYGQYI